MTGSCFENPASLALFPDSQNPALPELMDMGYSLGQEAAKLGGALNPIVRMAVGDLVRSMNCYYSNLIEGHNTFPRDIDQALENDYSTDPEKRNLQLEAIAHIEVQKMIDQGRLDDVGLGSDLIKRLHREFCERLPQALLSSIDPVTGAVHTVVPGEWRHVGIIVGQHVAVEPEVINGFMMHFDKGYDPVRVGRSRAAIAAAASHHRLVWIHPFLDGNGRVARLFSHAYLRHFNIGSDLWSVSRGLARSSGQYKAALQRADATPQSMTDGRGTLSDSRLCDFIKYFISTCLDQVAFMAKLLNVPDFLTNLGNFVRTEVAQNRLDMRVLPVLERIFMLGELPKDQVAGIFGLTDRHARRLLEPLVKRRILVSENKMAPYQLSFPLSESAILFPRLFAPIGTEE